MSVNGPPSVAEIIGLFNRYSELIQIIISDGQVDFPDGQVDFPIVFTDCRDLTEETEKVNWGRDGF